MTSNWIEAAPSTGDMAASGCAVDDLKLVTERNYDAQEGDKCRDYLVRIHELVAFLETPSTPQPGRQTPRARATPDPVTASRGVRCVPFGDSASSRARASGEGRWRRACGGGL
jgi:hypothetical protein